jgi:hypothetical protein
MSVLPIGKLSAPETTQASSSTSIAQSHQKKAAHALQGAFGIAASNALSAIGSARVAVSNNVQAALNNLKPGS